MRTLKAHLLTITQSTCSVLENKSGCVFGPKGVYLSCHCCVINPSNTHRYRMFWWEPKQHVCVFMCGGLKTSNHDHLQAQYTVPSERSPVRQCLASLSMPLWRSWSSQHTMSCRIAWIESSAAAEEGLVTKGNNNAEQAVRDHRRSAEDSFVHHHYWSPSVVTGERKEEEGGPSIYIYY